MFVVLICEGMSRRDVLQRWIVRVMVVGVGGGGDCHRCLVTVLIQEWVARGLWWSLVLVVVVM